MIPDLRLRSQDANTDIDTGTTIQSTKGRFLEKANQFVIKTSLF